MFNEDTLRIDIVKTWGEHGAHVEVFDLMEHEIELLRDDIVRYRVLINELADAEQGNSEQTWSDALTALYQAVGR
jgi:hypothetical protein